MNKLLLALVVAASGASLAPGEAEAQVAGGISRRVGGGLGASRVMAPSGGLGGPRMVTGIGGVPSGVTGARPRGAYRGTVPGGYRVTAATIPPWGVFRSAPGGRVFRYPYDSGTTAGLTMGGLSYPAHWVYGLEECRWISRRVAGSANGGIASRRVQVCF